MSRKKVSYSNLLKEAIAEFDTSKTVDVKGPMLDPILKWDGQGELPIYKDAASILERYYFNENSDKGVEVVESEFNEDGTEAKTASEKDAEGEGTEQAGTSKVAIPAEKKEIAKDLAKEAEEVEVDDDEEEIEEKVAIKKEQDEEVEDDEDEVEVEESKKLTEDLENSVIEKLIAEMEEEDEDEDEAEEVEESAGPEEDAQGAGTQQAGTGSADGQVPDRKDVADQMVKPKNYNEQDEEAAKVDDEGDEEEDLDVDEKIKEIAGVGAGPVPPMAAKAKSDNKEGDEADAYEEAFKIFKESIEDSD